MTSWGMHSQSREAVSHGHGGVRPLPREIIDGAWLQVALALSIESCGEGSLRSLGSAGGPSCLNRSIRGHQGESGRRAHPRIDGWMMDDDPFAASTESRGDARRHRSARFPLMTQLAKPSGAEDGASSPMRCPAKKFRYSSHSEPAATRRRAWRCRGGRNPRRRAGESHGESAILAPDHLLP